MIHLCAAFLMSFTAPMYQCVGSDHSELLLVFENGEFQRAVHRSISIPEMPTTVVMPKDRSTITTVDGVVNVRSELPEETVLQLKLSAKPEVSYWLEGNLLGTVQFNCRPFKGR